MVKDWLVIFQAVCKASIHTLFLPSVGQIHPKLLSIPFYRTERMDAASTGRNHLVDFISRG